MDFIKIQFFLRIRILYLPQVYYECILKINTINRVPLISRPLRQRRILIILQRVFVSHKIHLYPEYLESGTPFWQHFFSTTQFILPVTNNHWNTNSEHLQYQKMFVLRLFLPSHFYSIQQISKFNNPQQTRKNIVYEKRYSNNNTTSSHSPFQQITTKSISELWLSRS